VDCRTSTSHRLHRLDVADQGLQCSGRGQLVLILFQVRGMGIGLGGRGGTKESR
jgi:hypothetical protein